jgi:hypothetical protein
MPLSSQGTTAACRQGGQEGKVELWEEAEKVLDRMAADAEGQGRKGYSYRRSTRLLTTT